MTSLLLRAVRLLPLLALVALCASCGFFVSGSSIETVTVSPSAILLVTPTATAPGDSYTLTSSSTTVGSTQTTDTTTATWSSSPTGVVSVTNGVVTAVGQTSGTTTVTATDGGVSGTCAVMTVTTVPTAITVTTGGTTIPSTGLPAGTYSFRAFLGSDSSGPEVTNYVTWSSNNTAAATVNATTGQVTVLSLAIPTSVTITATANLGAAGTASPTTVSGPLQFTAD